MSIALEAKMLRERRGGRGRPVLPGHRPGPSAGPGREAQP